MKYFSRDLIKRIKLFKRACRADIVDLPKDVQVIVKKSSTFSASEIRAAFKRASIRMKAT